MKLAELAKIVGAEVAQSDGDIEITGAAGLDEAEPGHITFLSNPRYTPRVKGTRASAIFVAAGTASEGEIAAVQAQDPYLAYTRALRVFHPETQAEPFRHPSAVIESSADVDPTASIGANVYVGHNSRIGARCWLMANVTVYDNVDMGEDCRIHSGVALREGTIVGSRVTIHNNSVIGSDGFGYAKDERKRWLKIPQTGRVAIEDDVEIGAGTTIDCASVGETRIKRGAKIDNLVQIGHSCLVGEDALLCAQVGLAGSSRIGDRVILAGQAGVAGHLTIGNDAVVTAKSATSHNVEPGKVISGIPAFDNRDWLRSTAAFRRLGEMQKTIRQLESRLASLEKTSEESTE